MIARGWSDASRTMLHEMCRATPTAHTEADAGRKRYSGDQTRRGPLSASPPSLDLSRFFEERFGF